MYEVFHTIKKSKMGDQYKTVWWYSESENIKSELPNIKELETIIKKTKRFSKAVGNEPRCGSNEDHILKLQREAKRLKEEWSRLWELKAYLTDSTDRWIKAAGKHEELKEKVLELSILKT